MGSLEIRLVQVPEVLSVHKESIMKTAEKDFAKDLLIGLTVGVICSVILIAVAAMLGIFQ